MTQAVLPEGIETQLRSACQTAVLLPDNLAYEGEPSGASALQFVDTSGFAEDMHEALHSSAGYSTACLGYETSERKAVSFCPSTSALVDEINQSVTSDPLERSASSKAIQKRPYYSIEHKQHKVCPVLASMLKEGNIYKMVQPPPAAQPPGQARRLVPRSKMDVYQKLHGAVPKASGSSFKLPEGGFKLPESDSLSEFTNDATALVPYTGSLEPTRTNLGAGGCEEFSEMYLQGNRGDSLTDLLNKPLLAQKKAPPPPRLLPDSTVKASGSFRGDSLTNLLNKPLLPQKEAPPPPLLLPDGTRGDSLTDLLNKPLQQQKKAPPPPLRLPDGTLLGWRSQD
jgi:hypothetical protein